MYSVFTGTAEQLYDMPHNKLSLGRLVFKGNAQIHFLESFSMLRCSSAVKYLSCLLTLVFLVHSTYTQLNREAGFFELEVAAGTL